MAPLKVCVIGGGPSAMFMCHSWNTQRKEHAAAAAKDAADAEEEDTPNPSPRSSFQELDITCFEQHSSPGGVWRTHPEDVAAYEELWTNGCCYSLEFHDYTFDQHFDGASLPVFLPRQDISEYITRRVTRNHPSFFDDYFQFNTKVVKVEPIPRGSHDINEGEGTMFRVTTQYLPTLEITIHLFDKCIWAAGANSRGSTPAALQALFDEAHQQAAAQEHDPSSPPTPSPPFTVLHSTETKQIRNNVKGRQVLLVGGHYSAEDLTLQCLKWGASHVHVVTRDDDAAVTWTSQWPGPDKVHIYARKAIQAVRLHDRSIVLADVQFEWPNDYSRTTDPSATSTDDTATVISDIQTVVFCTGYAANLTMLDDSLRPACGNIPAWFMGTDPSCQMSELKPALASWKMNPTNNRLHKFVGDVPAFTDKMIRINYNHPEMHRGIFFHNPNLMFLCEHASDTPLLSLDVHAWLLCSYLTGRVPTPSVPELIQANHKEVMDQMDLPYLRLYFDQGYYNAVAKANETENVDIWDDEMDELELDYINYQFRRLAGVMQEGHYPGKSFGTYQELNETGLAMVAFGDADYCMRTELDAHEDGHDWRTFRDDDIHPERMYSLYTGRCARPLKHRWMNIRTDPKMGPVSVKHGII